MHGTSIYDQTVFYLFQFVKNYHIVQLLFPSKRKS